MAETLHIERLGHRGDGIAMRRGAPVYVAGALAGETVEADGDGDRLQLVGVVTPSPHRIDAPCIHFGTCGGCAVQHLAHDAVAVWKRDLLVHALADRGLDLPVDDTWTAPEASRRRAVFAVRQMRGGVRFGFHETRSNALLAIEACPVLVPAIAGRLAPLRKLAARFAPRKGEATVTVLAARNGLDVAIGGSGIDPWGHDVASAMQRAGVVRLAVDGALALQLEEPVVEMAGVAAVPASGGFVQASAAAEEFLRALTLEWIGGAPSADLFCGMGAFALGLAKTAPVTAIDGDAAAINALAAATRRASGLKQVDAVRRDLFRTPLQPAELARFEGVVLDPPRAGAQLQCEALAKSALPRIVSISCNPATFARDLRILIDGGYRARRIVPVDQFRHSPHIEAIALLERE